jgi:hypothetical protein
MEYHIDSRTSEDMSGIGKHNLDLRCQWEEVIIGNTEKMMQAAPGIILVVNGFQWWQTLSGPVFLLLTLVLLSCNVRNPSNNIIGT